MSSKLAIIPARGGSKRIPGKNLREFRGKPIIAYSIEAALGSGLFDEVMVSSDDPAILECARRYGAATPFARSAATSGDTATTAEALREVLDAYAARGRSFDRFCCVYATAPFVTADLLREADRRLDAESADAAVTVTRFAFPPQRSLVVRDGRLVFLQPENASRRSQDLETAYQDAGQIYFCRTESFLRQGSVWAGSVVPIERDELEVQDIDRETDWKIAELKYDLLRAAGSARG